MPSHSESVRTGSCASLGSRTPRSMARRIARHRLCAVHPSQAWASKSPRLPRLQRNRQQRVEAAAVADDDALAKAQGAAVVDQKVEIAAGGEEIHRAVAHDADHEERRLGAYGAVDLTEDRRQADEVTIGLTLV